jgi:hypothetical protein
MVQVRERVGSVDARARHDTRRVQWFAMGLEEVVERAVAAHWADGALESDLRLADIRARRRAMEVRLLFFPPRAAVASACCYGRLSPRLPRHHHAYSTLSSSH